MPRFRTSMVLGIVLAFALLASLACGSKKEEAKTTATPTSAAATAAAKTSATAAAATAAAKTGGSVAVPGSAAAMAAAICGNWKTVSAMAGPGAVPSGPPTGAPAGPPNFAATEANMKQMVDNAPPELKPDFAVFAKYFSEYSAAMTRANGDMMKLAQDAQFIKMMESGTADVEKASKNIDAWTQKNC